MPTFGFQSRGPQSNRFPAGLGYHTARRGKWKPKGCFRKGGTSPTLQAVLQSDSIIVMTIPVVLQVVAHEELEQAEIN